jgi:hypothetical protein
VEEDTSITVAALDEPKAILDHCNNTKLPGMVSLARLLTIIMMLLRLIIKKLNSASFSTQAPLLHATTCCKHNWMYFIATTITITTITTTDLEGAHNLHCAI